MTRLQVINARGKRPGDMDTGHFDPDRRRQARFVRRAINEHMRGRK